MQKDVRIISVIISIRLYVEVETGE